MTAYHCTKTSRLILYLDCHQDVQYGRRSGRKNFDSFTVAWGMVICRHCKWFSPVGACCWSIYSSTRVRLTSSPVVHTESFQNWSRPMCSKPYPLTADHRSNLLWLWCTTTNDNAYCWRFSSDQIPERSSGSTSCWGDCTHLARHAKQTIKKRKNS